MRFVYETVKQISFINHVYFCGQSRLLYVIVDWQVRQQGRGLVILHLLLFNTFNCLNVNHNDTNTLQTSC